MFKLAHNGNILLDVHEHSPPSAAFIIEALEKSSFCECRVDHDAINNFFKTDMKERTLVVASKHDASLEITLSDDKMLATGELTLAEGGTIMSLENAKKELIKAGVARGYKQAYLEKLLQQQLELPAGEKVKGVVAKGRLPVDGQPSKLVPQVETLKDRLKKPTLREDGTVDMRDFGKLASVEPGVLLVKQIPATPGKEGFTVTGDVLPAKAGESSALVAGEGTEISKNNPLELVSAISGVPVDIANGMRVDDIFTIADVNVKSGHVDFEGSVIVTHNVEPGMRINAKGDITVMGTVESGHLSAIGDITIKQGVIGHQLDDKTLSCNIISQGDIHLSHGQYSYLEANNIIIERQSSHCIMKAKKLLQVGQEDNPQGKLFGGEILDAQIIIAGEIGNESGAKMVVNLAASGADVTAETDQCLKDLAQTDSQLDTLQEAIEKADQVKDAEKKKLLLAKIGATQNHYCQQAEQLEKKLSSLEHHLHDLLEDAELVVNKALHSGVEIHIFDKVLRTNRQYPPCKVKLEENKIEVEFKTS
ncbi:MULTISPECIES: FapA family protein [unclassified Pseudoalteromonas]|uniref:DUF342 domain-containing protein n=1 Tax=unclassified Pseudoalteromonas TaxID=194690 RepID=UPI001023DC8A|nr:FapA family protein [Pseudoalteromonas sp. L1]RZF91486.1 DUF342 domain-containing protein [Pseudoalteromonas sp. CO302Y]RZG07219.1 DUF342 domain-containing protein [Pseudoalteromonas sp. CO133X]